MMTPIDSIMTTFVRAIVDDEEKAAARRRARELGMTESELVRAGLKKMGVRISVEKQRGAPLGNKNNPHLGRKEREQK